MENEGKIVELLAEMLVKQDAMVVELRDVKSEVRNVKSEIRDVKSEMVKLNLQTSENSRSILRLADELHAVADHERRISKLESTVYK